MDVTKNKRNSKEKEGSTQEDAKESKNKKTRVDDDKEDDDDQSKTSEDATAPTADEPDVIPPIKVSPQKKVVAKSVITTPARITTKTVQVIKVSPKNVTGNPLNGLVVVCLGFMMDKYCVDKLYKKATNKEKIEFIDNTGSIPWVITEVLDKKGHLMKRKKTGRAIKAMAAITNKAHSNEEIMTYVNETINPITWNNYLDMEQDVEKGWGDEANLPKLSSATTDDIWEVDTWDQAIRLPEEVFKVGQSVTGDLTEWLKEDKNNLYQLFQEGKVPVNKHRQQNLPPHLLRADDLKKYNQSITTKVSQT